MRYAGAMISVDGARPPSHRAGDLFAGRRLAVISSASNFFRDGAPAYPYTQRHNSRAEFLGRSLGLRSFAGGAYRFALPYLVT